jgi:hypothetical protein
MAWYYYTRLELYQQQCIKPQKNPRPLCKPNKKQIQPTIPIKFAVPITSSSSPCYTTPANYSSTFHQKQQKTQNAERRTHNAKRKIKKATQLDAKKSSSTEGVSYRFQLQCLALPLPCFHPSCSRVYAPRSMFPSRVLFVAFPFALRSFGLLLFAALSTLFLTQRYSRWDCLQCM